jgi:putative ABC transport system permease protein
LVQAAICLLAPVLISLLPVIAGVRVTVREAISTYGLNARASRLTRWLAGFQRLSRLIILMVNNTFRHKGRVILTQLTLVGSGLIFMMVMSTWDSVLFTFDDMLFDILRYNVTFQFEEPERIDQVESLALAHPDVKAVEMWGIAQATIRPAGQAEANDDEAVIIFGVPLPTELYGPRLSAGRWLEPGQGFTVVLNQALARNTGLAVGDRITLDQNVYGESQWTVTGLLIDPVIPNTVYMSREMLLRQTKSVGEAETVWIQTGRSDRAGEIAAALDLRRYFNERKLEVNPQGIFPRDTATELAEQIRQNFGVIIVLLATVALVMGLVGAITLSGVLSLSVLERTREIGVMRAIGATSRIIATLFIGEGLTLGWLSWLIAWPLSIPASVLMTQVLGQAIDNDIVYIYTPNGALYWLAIVTVLSIAASWLPARAATRVSVAQSLVYQ